MKPHSKRVENSSVVALEPLSIPKSRSFLPAVLIFCVALFTNVKALQYANVETVIVFRLELTVVLDYYEAKETYSRIGLLRS